MQIPSDVYAHISKKFESDSVSKFEAHMQSIYGRKICGCFVGAAKPTTYFLTSPTKRKNPSHLVAQGVNAY